MSSIPAWLLRHNGKEKLLGKHLLGTFLRSVALRMVETHSVGSTDNSKAGLNTSCSVLRLFFMANRRFEALNLFNVFKSFFPFLF